MKITDTYHAVRIAATQYVNLTYKAKIYEGYQDPTFFKIADNARQNAQRWLFTYNKKLAQLATEQNVKYVKRWGPEDFLQQDNNRP